MQTGLSAFDARHNFVLSTTYPLPFHFQQKVLGGVFGGWTVNGIDTFRSGEPLDARVALTFPPTGPVVPGSAQLEAGLQQQSNVRSFRGLHDWKEDNPAGTPLGTPSLWYDPCALSRPAPGTYGTLGRNTMTGPGLQEVDASLEKVLKPIERMNIEARAEVFNLLDHANFIFLGSTSLREAPV
jgi:hypothetical protein